MSLSSLSTYSLKVPQIPVGTISRVKNPLYYLLICALVVKMPSWSLNSLKVKRVSAWFSNKFLARLPGLNNKSLVDTLITLP